MLTFSQQTFVFGVFILLMITFVVLFKDNEEVKIWISFRDRLLEFYWVSQNDADTDMPHDIQIKTRFLVKGSVDYLKSNKLFRFLDLVISFAHILSRYVRDL